MVKFALKLLQILRVKNVDFFYILVFREWRACFNQIDLMLRSWARQLKFDPSVVFLSSLKITLKNTFNMVSISPYSYLFSQKRRVFSNTWFNCGIQRTCVSQRGSHFISLRRRLYPNGLLPLLYSISSPFYSLQRTYWFIMIVFFDEIGKLSSSNPKSSWIRVKLFVEWLKISTIWIWFLIISHYLMFLYQSIITSTKERLTLWVHLG